MMIRLEPATGAKTISLLVAGITQHVEVAQYMKSVNKLDTQDGHLGGH